MNERKNMSCRENPGMCREKEAVKELQRFGQSGRAGKCSAQHKLAGEHTAAPFVKGSGRMLQTC